MISSCLQDNPEALNLTDSNLFKHLEKLSDPRTGWTLKHEFIDIVVIAILAVLSGADGWNDIEEYGQSKQEWLKGFLKLPNGIPSHDTFNNVIRCIDPEQFANCFDNWIAAITEMIDVQVIPIDGKTHRGSYDRTNKQKALHTVSAWASSNRILLGQVKVERKSNEITAIPKLLETIDIKGCIITIADARPSGFPTRKAHQADAMGCQKAVANQIVQKEGDYVLALKGNQPNLLAAVKQAFEKVNVPETQILHEFDESIETGHHRIDSRKCWVIPATSISAAWPSTQTLVMVKSQRKCWNKISTETKYYISSLSSDVAKIAGAIRSHWSIENQLHWFLDVVFGEDDCRIRKDYGAENFGTLRRLALGLLQRETSVKKSIRLKRYRASMNNDYLLKVLLS
jgi:predicted transposase YbfD/YdcC